jgi:hypothetical protein
MNLRVLRRKVNWVRSTISTVARMAEEINIKFILSVLVSKNKTVTRHEFSALPILLCVRVRSVRADNFLSSVFSCVGTLKVSHFPIRIISERCF